MADRRQFMWQAVMTSIAAASPGARVVLAALSRRGGVLTEGGGDHEEPHPFFRILYDDTSIEGRLFGVEAAALGAQTRAVGADLGGIWLREIEPRWKCGPAALAGLTTGPHLFCLELLARDYGMGVVHRTRHPRGAEHGWVREAAFAAVTCPVSAKPDARLDLVDLASDSRMAQAPLYSWVIAPASGPALAVQRTRAA